MQSLFYTIPLRTLNSEGGSPTHHLLPGISLTRNSSPWINVVRPGIRRSMPPSHNQARRLAPSLITAPAIKGLIPYTCLLFGNHARGVTRLHYPQKAHHRRPYSKIQLFSTQLCHLHRGRLPTFCCVWITPARRR